MTILRPTPIDKIGVNAGIAMISRDLGEPADHPRSLDLRNLPFLAVVLPRGEYRGSARVGGGKRKGEQTID